MIEEETLEQKHSCEVKTDWSDDAHKCDREGDSEVKGAPVETRAWEALLVVFLTKGFTALNFGAIIAKVFFPFRSPTGGTDTWAVCKELLSKGKGARLGVDVAKQDEVAVLVCMLGITNDGTH